MYGDEDKKINCKTQALKCTQQNYTKWKFLFCLPKPIADAGLDWPNSRSQDQRFGIF